MTRIKKKSKKPNKDKTLWLKRLGIKIKEMRLKSEMSQADLAYSIDMDAQNISRIERGLVNPSAFAVMQICKSLNIRLSKFYIDLDLYKHDQSG